MSGAGPGPYDGHEEYRKQFERRPPRVYGRAVARTVLAIGVGLAAMRLIYKLIFPGENMLLIFTGPIAAIAGIIIGALAHSWLNRARGEPDSLGYKEAIAGAIFLFVFLIPVMSNRAQETRQRQQAHAQQEADEQERKKALQARLEEGMAAIRAAGRYAEPGVVPPEFEVRDKGVSVSVTYRGTMGSMISLSRVIADPSAPGGWRGCPLWTNGTMASGRFYSHYINPEMTLVFTMYLECVAEFRDAPLEFRVGDPQGGAIYGARAWWSESAFARPQGREWEYWERRAAESKRAQ